MKTITVSVAGKRLVVEIDATAMVKWENRAKAAGLSLSRCLSLFLSEEVQRT